MSILTVTAKGQITLRRELLRHLGVAPGDKIEVDQLPDGKLAIRASKPRGQICDAFGLLESRNIENITLSIDEIDTLTKAAWAGKSNENNS